eukprot:scaffold319_cov97-Cylindrotheca_fusiformis.AAC.13
MIEVPVVEEHSLSVVFPRVHEYTTDGLIEERSTSNWSIRGVSLSKNSRVHDRRVNSPFVVVDFPRTREYTVRFLKIQFFDRGFFGDVVVKTEGSTEERSTLNWSIRSSGQEQ